MSSDIETADGELPSAGVDPAAHDPRSTLLWTSPSRGFSSTSTRGRAGRGCSSWCSCEPPVVPGRRRAAGGRACARRGDRGAAGSGVLLAAILAQSLGQEVVGASLTVSWRKTRGLDLDSLGSSLARAVPRGGRARPPSSRRRARLRTRQAVRLRTRQMARCRDRRSGGVALHQLFVPMADTNWMAVVTATTGLLRLCRSGGHCRARRREHPGRRCHGIARGILSCPPRRIFAARLPSALDDRYPSRSSGRPASARGVSTAHAGGPAPGPSAWSRLVARRGRRSCRACNRALLGRRCTPAGRPSRGFDDPPTFLHKDSACPPRTSSTPACCWLIPGAHALRRTRGGSSDSRRHRAGGQAPPSRARLLRPTGASFSTRCAYPWGPARVAPDWVARRHAPGGDESRGLHSTAGRLPAG